MKLKNLAFFGVMGAILSVAGANAATGDNYLTTKGYVDARDAATQAAAVAAAATAAQQAGYITKDVNDLTNYYTKTVADGKYDASGAASTAETNAKAYTDAEIGDLDSSATADTGKVLTGVTVTDGKITAKTDTALPTKVSDLTNDTGFITEGDLPTKTSDLQNDSGFITNAVNNLTNYTTTTAMNTAIDDAKAAAITAAASDATTKANAAQSAAETYTDTEIGKLDSSATATAGSALTGVTVVDGKITGKTEAVIPAAQVQSDWNATTGMGEILNKPTLGTMAAASTNDYYTKTAADAAFDAAGAASTAETTAKDYTDTKLADYTKTANLGTAAFAATTDFDAAGTASTAIAALDGTANATTNQVVTGVTTTDGVVTAVSSTLIANANVSDSAAIAPSKLNLGTCAEGRDCILTYGANGYVATPITKEGVDYTSGS